MNGAPPTAALAGFGVPGSPVLLSGGQGQTWMCGDVILKTVEDAEEAVWSAELFSELRQDGFRVARPVRSTDGGWVVSGWTAWRRVAGEHDLISRWPEVLRVGERFHDALAAVERPAFLDRRRNPWSAGDRVAWGERQPDIINDAFRPLLHSLLSFLRPLATAEQVIHGDLSGNVLFAPEQAPAVIDFAPYFRPAGFGLAIVLVDALAWYGADATLLIDAAHIPDLDQLIARAAIYRLITADQVAQGRDAAWTASQIQAHAQFVGLVGA